MLQNEEDSPYDSSSKMFLGVRFILLGFDFVQEAKVRSKLINGGGVDAREYGPNCTHVIVDKLVYDDSNCVAARSDGKTLVTGLWVDHSYDIGMPDDATSILYRPVKDLNGIPGAKLLCICLTGYLRQDRDDIMRMVGLMGAHFSKPLVANKITHLICYKFEGEKYDLAKKMKKIKLVNHRWLEACLRAWEILPEGNYNKSGYELEIMEAEAKDSEEETEENRDTKHFSERNIAGYPSNLQGGSGSMIPKGSELPIPVVEVSKIHQKAVALEGSSDFPEEIATINRLLTTPGKEPRTEKAPDLNDVNKEGLEEFACQGTGAYCGDPVSGGLPLTYHKTPNFSKGGSGLTSNTRTSKRSPPSDAAEYSTLSYSGKTPRRSPVSIFSELSSHVCGSPQGHLEEYKDKDGFDILPSKLEQDRDNLDFSGIQILRNDTELHHGEGKSGTLPQKRKAAHSLTSSVSPKKGSLESKACPTGNQSASTRSEGLMIGAPQLKSIPSCGYSSHPMEGLAIVNIVEDQSANVSKAKSISFNRKSLKRGLPVLGTMTSESTKSPSEVKVSDSTKESKPERFSGGLKQSNLTVEPDDGVVRMSKSKELLAGKTGNPQGQQQDDEVSSPNTRNSEIEKSRGPASLGVLKGRNNETSSRSHTKKMVAKKSLCSRPKLSTGNTNKHKGSFYLDKTVTENEATFCSVEGKNGAENEKIISVEPGMARPTFKTDSVIKEKVKGVLCSANKIKNNTVCMDDETEAPEEYNDGVEFEKGVNEMAGQTSKSDVAMEEKSEGEQHLANETKGHTVCMDDKTPTSGEDGAVLEKAARGKKTEVGGSTFKADAVEVMTTGGKHPSSKTKKKSVSSVKEIETSEKAEDGAKLENKTNDEKMEMRKTKEVLCPASKTKCKTVIVNKTEKSMDAEKENGPIANGGRNVNPGKHRKAKVAVISNRTPMQISKMVSVNDPDGRQAGGEGSDFVKSDPMWFILSGHRLQRKEFQQFIRRLKGRLCRDSHHWSYQATHFIVPDPIRRTEKFFAAAASGRWILKTDYLSASNQAGRFLAEEPYEWFKHGLSEEGTINLEAPRKWRLLRERTGHGAFYGMQIIIYGECIAPPLDTLKRVVKAGDGTILATSPPYTRFLKSGVDFAIVSPGMPRVDSWVQEFLRHEIPCIVADYLVEYVCKPGYSLDRHVLYKTHAWAEKSFANMLSRSEEIVNASMPLDSDDSDDLTCQVCGSRDRGEVMLVCGDESGSMGCGVGTHIDCCDPPLKSVPKEDWFCPRCSKSRDSTNLPKSTKKGSSLSKYK